MHERSVAAANLMLSASHYGFLAAAERYKALRGETSDEEALFVPLVEALWWARALDEHFERERGTEYVTQREADRAGQVLHGIRYARNRAGHDLASVLSFQPGLALPMRLPVRIGDVKWRPLAQLPEPAWRERT